MRSSDATRIEKIREIINEAKSVPCVDCGGEFHFSQMDLDHRPDEEKLLSRRQSFSSWAKSVSFAKLYFELEKCDVRCANCHRLKTYIEQVEFVGTVVAA